MAKYLSYNDLDAIAACVFRAYSKLPEVQAAGQVLYVDPDILLKNLLGLTIEYRHLSEDGTTLGITAYDDVGVEICDEDEDLFFFDGKTVLIEKDLQTENQTGRRNFTIVHEGCHHILKMLFPKDYGCGANARRVLRYRDVRNERTREEWQVDRLTSSILMPQELVEQAMSLVGQSGRIDMLNAAWRRKEYEKFCNMCYLLGVSKQALSIRMMRLGLLGEEHLRHPNEILDIVTVMLGGIEYYRTRIEDADGKRVALYGRTREELYDKVEEAKRQIEECSFRRETPTVKEYCEKWLLMQSAHVRATTLLDYTSKVKNYIIKPLGHMYMADVTPDDVKLAVLPAAKKSESVYRSVNMLMKCIFYSAEDSHIIDENPTKKLSAKGGVPQKTKEALTDEQVDLLLDSIKGLPPYVFVMLGLYAGLRREEILALKWDCVFLDVEAPYLSVRRAWHTEHNRPVILTELKTKAASRDVPLPKCLVECLKEAKENSTSEYVVANSEGEPLSYTQFKRVWQYIVTRSTKERTYVRYVNGEKIKHTISPVLGEVAPHNGKVTYSMDFQVTPHQLRHTYITNLIYAQVDPKTVQYLAGHENSKITMDIYAKVKYNKPKELAAVVNGAFGQ